MELKQVSFVERSSQSRKVAKVLVSFSERLSLSQMSNNTLKYYHGVETTVPYIEVTPISEGPLSEVSYGVLIVLQFSRTVEEVWEAGVPGPGQRWEDHSTPHVERQQNGTARSHPICQYVYNMPVCPRCLTVCCVVHDTHSLEFTSQLLHVCIQCTGHCACDTECV